MTKESDAIQKLDKEVRGIFWRYVPFSKEVKEKLKDRSYTYQDLYQRDINRSLSDGY
jgi:predicted DCC family thiol-disulfide oxidoreductase YuxK